jgi:glycosyltransferase involved in cell wall biosynthesis
MNETTPLISVLVFTYNSAPFIRETLESIKTQTYSNLEVIVSDDHSTDGTVELVQEWMEKNCRQFTRCELITVEQNTRTCANLNRGLRAATGEWIKFIAGDDFLFPNCISEFVNEVQARPEIDFLFCNMAVNGKETISTELLHFFSLNNQEQYKILLKNSILPAPANFIRRKALFEINYFDERYGLFDDFPFFLKALQAGFRFYHVNKPLVYYRVHGTNVSHQQKINFAYYHDVMLYYKEVYLRELWKQKMVLHYLHCQLEYVLLWLISKRVITSYHVYSGIRNWVSPLHWKLRLQKRLSL